MSGHSKWANIKRKKEVNDKARASVFAKLSRLITLAVVQGNGNTDPASNLRLRLAIEKAKQDNMPKENIQRAIEKGTGPHKDQLKEVKYEGFGAGGAALLIIGSTDNLNRTSSEIRNVLENEGGKLASPGAVSYFFEQSAMIAFDLSHNKEDDVLRFAESIGAIDVDEDENILTVYFPFAKLGLVKDFINNLTPLSPPEQTFRPTSPISLTSENDREKLLKQMQVLEELDDVQSVYTNATI